MKTYELIIERKQPSCGGKSPKEVKVQTVTVEDPVAYVKELEGTENVTVETRENGEIVVNLDIGMKQIQYSFTEE